MVKEKLAHYNTYHYVIRTLYNHGEEMVILASRLPSTADNAIGSDSGMTPSNLERNVS
jgi:hypothetical protein